MGNRTVELSIVVPLFNEEEVLDVLLPRLVTNADKIAVSYEVILVNDGSADGTLAKIKAACKINPNLKYISFARNFGHQLAITAGLEKASGEAIITIDGDLQDPPELMYEMYGKYTEGYKVVYAQRSGRKGETFAKKAFAFVFYRLLAGIATFKIPLDVGDFRLLSRDVVRHLLQMKDYDKYLRGQIAWLGFKSAFVQYDRDERKFGKTGYSGKKMFQLAFNGITFFSDAPLKIATRLGLTVCVISFCLALVAFYSYFYGKIIVRGWPSLMIAITFLGGVQLLSLGILGEYISRIINNVRSRPLYIVEESTFNE